MLKTREERAFQIIANVIMMIAALLAIIPMVLLLVSSFTANSALIRDGYSFFPKEWSIDNYTYVFTNNGGAVLRAYGVSFILTAVGTVLGTVITVMLGYTLSKQGMPGRGVLTFLVFFTMLFNGGLVPTYINYTTYFGIKDTFFGLLLPGLLMNGFNVMLVKSYFVTGVPEEILESARIDGAGEMRTFTSIAVPMAKPIIATVALFIGIAYWNDWNNGLVYLKKRSDLYSIQNLLNRLSTNIQFLLTNATVQDNAQQGLAEIPSEGVRMSMAVLGVLPIIIIYPFVQNNFVKGITLGGVKG